MLFIQLTIIIIVALWQIKNELSEQEQNTQSRRTRIKALERAYQNGFYSNGRVADNDLEANLQNLFAQYNQWGASTVFLYVFLKPLTKYPNAFNQLVSESWGGAYYSPTLQAIHYWYCEGKAIQAIEKFNPELAEDDMRDYLNALVAFLFNRYPVPEVMNEVWWTWNWYDAEEMSEQTGFKQADEAMCFQRNVLFHWYFTVAEGQNLRLSPYLPVALSKQAAYWFSNAPKDLSLLQTFYWAKAKAKGLNDKLAMIAAQQSGDFLANSTLFEAICDCIAKEKEDNVEKISTFIRFVMMVKAGSASDDFAYFGMNLMPNLSLSGRTVASVLRIRQAFHKAMGSINKEASYPSIDWLKFTVSKPTNLIFLNENYLLKCLAETKRITHFSLYNADDVLLATIDKTNEQNWKTNLMFRVKIYTILSKRDFPKVELLEDRFEIENNGKAFEIVRLSSLEALMEEALLMEHCVASYGPECNSGGTSIWSLREIDNKGDKRLTTIQLTNYRIVQASGKLNVEPEPLVWDLMRTWKKENLVLAQDTVESEIDCLV